MTERHGRGEIREPPGKQERRAHEAVLGDNSVCVSGSASRVRDNDGGAAWEGERPESVGPAGKECECLKCCP